MSNVDLFKYQQFVDGVTSNPSKQYLALVERIRELDQEYLGSGEYRHSNKIPRLLTAALGLSSEAGEFTEIVKKILLQGKPFDDAARVHMAKELGDALWYVQQACMALDVSMETVIRINVDKLSARYPGGQFSVERSEQRAEGDL